MARPTAQARKKKGSKAEAPKPAEDAAENLEVAEAVEGAEDDVPEGEMDIKQEEEESKDEDVDEAAENDMLADDDDEADKSKEGEAMEVEGGDEEDQEEEDDEGEDDDDESESNENNQTKRKKVQAEIKKTKKPKIEKPVRVNVYLPNLKEENLDDALQNLFTSSDIEVKEIRKSEDKTWVLYGEVELAKIADKDRVLTMTGREVVEGREIKVELVVEEEPEVKIEAPDECILFIKNIEKLTTEESLQELFPEAKTIKLPEKDQQNRGFAFLEFETKEIVEELIKEKQSVELDGNKLELSLFTANKKKKSASRMAKTKVLFIGNLNYDTKESTVKPKFPTCTEVRILKFPHTGKSKGVGFVEFKSFEDAEEAYIKNKDNLSIDDRDVLVDYAADKRDSSSNDRRYGGGRGAGRGGGRGRGLDRDRGFRGGGAVGGGYESGYSREGGGRFSSDRMRTMLELEADYAYADRMALERRIAMGRMGLERDLEVWGRIGMDSAAGGYGDYVGYAMGGSGGGYGAGGSWNDYNSGQGRNRNKRW